VTRHKQTIRARTVDYLPTLVVRPDNGGATQVAEQLRHAGFATETATSCWAALKPADHGWLNDASREGVFDPVDTPNARLGIIVTNGYANEVLPVARPPVVNITDSTRQRTPSSQVMKSAPSRDPANRSFRRCLPRCVTSKMEAVAPPAPAIAKKQAGPCYSFCLVRCAMNAGFQVCPPSPE
jgi:hypothetical protein